MSWHDTVGLKLRLGDLLDEEDSFEVWVHIWVWGCSLSGQGSLKLDMSSSPEALIYIHRLRESFSSGQNFLAWQPLCWDQCRGCRQRCLVFHLPVCLHLLFPALEFRRKLFVGGDLFFWWAWAALFHSGSLICERLLDASSVYKFNIWKYFSVNHDKGILPLLPLQYLSLQKSLWLCMCSGSEHVLLFQRWCHETVACSD